VVLERDLPWLDDLTRAKKPSRLPVVITLDEVEYLLNKLPGEKWLIGMV
jgi:hypothetical protein